MTATRKSILCVDKHQDTCSMLTALLGRANYQVTTANTLNDALDLARGEHFDLYVLDYWYRDGSGLDLCRKLRELTPQTPVIFHSGAVYQSDRQAGLSAGAQAYVSKPDLEGLIKTIRSLLNEDKEA